MSQKFYLSKSIQLKEVVSKTNMHIVEANGSYWLQKNTSPVGTMHICSIQEVEDKANYLETYFSELTGYFDRNWEPILEEIVITFQTEFLDEDEMQTIWHLPQEIVENMDMSPHHLKSLQRNGFDRQAESIIKMTT